MATNRLGRYEILGELGRGAMGVVYRARDPIIDRVVALKTINLALTGAALASFEARFFQEARSAGRLNHPNIVTIYDAGKADGVAYIAMEFLEGTSLREILDEQPPLSIPRILEAVAQVAREEKLHTLAMDANQVEDWLTVGIIPDEHKMKVVLNANCVRAAGGFFEVALLKVSKIYHYYKDPHPQAPSGPVTPGLTAPPPAPRP